MIFRCLVFLTFCMFCSWDAAVSQSAETIEPVSLPSEVQRIGGTDVLYFAEEKSGVFTANDAWQRRGDFKPYTLETIDFGYRSYPVWVLFKLRNEADAQTAVISIGRPQLMIAEIHVIEDGAPRQILNSKTDTGYSRRFQKYMALAQSEDFAAGETKTILVRIQSSHSSLLPLAVGPETQFISNTDTRLHITYIFTAVALTVIALNITLLILIGYKRLLWFPASQLFGVLNGWHINRYSNLFFEPMGRELSRFVDQVLTLGAILLLMQFARVFFKTHELYPKSDWIARGLIWAGILILLLELFGFVSGIYAPGFFVLLSTIVWLACFAAMIGVAIQARFARIPGAGWIFVAWIIYGSLVTYMVIEALTELPPIPYQSDLIVPLVALEAIMITHALGIYARRTVRERNAAQEQLSATLMNRIVGLEQLADRGKLLQAMGHDGRNLVSGLDYLLEEIEAAESLGDAKAHATRIQTLSSILADMQNIMVGNASNEGSTLGPIAIEPVDTDILLKTVQIVSGRPARSKGIEIRIHVGVREVMTDHMRVLRILTNLVSNAGKYSESGKILLACRRHGDTVRYQVFDQGNGLDEKEVERLYKARPIRFDQSQQGEGVGLNICQQFARDLGGELRISSKMGRGSLFELRLPVAPADREARLFKVGVIGSLSQWPPLDSRLKLIPIENAGRIEAGEVDALILSEENEHLRRKVLTSALVLVETFEKTSEIRARWAGKASALIYTPLSAEAIITAIISAAKN